MHIILNRWRKSKWGVDGRLYIGGAYIADTTEHPDAHLPPGVYPVTLKNMLLKRGNVPEGDSDRGIYVGQLRCQGLVVKSRETYIPIYGRIQKALKRGGEVMLEITEENEENEKSHPSQISR